MLRIDVSPIRDHAFFEQTQFERLLSHDFLQLLGLALEILDLVAGRCTGSVARQAPLAGFQELLGPTVVETLGNALAAAQLGDRVFAAQAVQHDADLLFGRVALARCSADVLDDLFR
jgi:hypothetical protein